MRVDLIVCMLALVLIPCCTVGTILWLRRRRGLGNDRFQVLGAALVAGICSYPVASVLWIGLSLAAGVVIGIGESDLGAGLRIGYDLAVPLDEVDDVRPWGLLPVVLCAAVANGVALRVWWRGR